MKLLLDMLEALTRFKVEIDRGALVVIEPQRARVRILPLD